MKRIKMMLALLAALVCGGAWAATPVAVWTNFTGADSADGLACEGGGYTLKANGNAVASDGSSIKITGDNGVLVNFTTAGNAYWVVVKYRNLDLINPVTQALFAMNNSEGGNRVGACVKAFNGGAKGISQADGGNASSGRYYEWPNNDTKGSAKLEHSGRLVLRHASSESPYGTYLYNNGVLAWGADGLRYSTHKYDGLSIGGLRGVTCQSSAKGMVIEGIAIFTSGSLADINNWTFDTESSFEYKHPYFGVEAGNSSNPLAVDGGQLVFSGIKTLEELKNYTIIATLNGSSVSDAQFSKVAQPLHSGFYDEETDGNGVLTSMKQQFQLVDDGYIKVAEVKFTVGANGIHAQQTAQKHNNKVKTALASRISMSEFSYDGAYIIFSLTATKSTTAKARVISINPYNQDHTEGSATSAAQETLIGTIPADGWTQQNGVNINSYTTVKVYDAATGTSSTISGVTVNQNGGGGANIGLLKLENGDNAETAVSGYAYMDQWLGKRWWGSCNTGMTVSGIPFAAYDVYVYFNGNFYYTDDGTVPSGKPSSYQFGKITLALNDGTAVDYSVSADGSAKAGVANAWGRVGYAKPELGVNAFVIKDLTAAKFAIAQSGVTSAGIAAIQIVEKPVKAVTLSADKTMSAILSETELAEGESLVVTVSGTATLTMDESVAGNLVSFVGTASDKLTIAHAEKQPLDVISFAGMAGEVTLEFDSTSVNYTAPANLMEMIKTSGSNFKFVFKGDGAKGATLSYGTTQTDTTLNTHIIFDGGTHVWQKYCDAQNLKFGANATAENPTFLVTGNATLTMNIKNPCGWTATGADSGIIRINDGSTLNYNQGAGTMYWNQQFYLEPGATLNSTETSDNFRINGGVKRTMPQIYVPATTADNTKVATITKASGSIMSNNQANKGFSIFVGENAKLVINAAFTKSNAESYISKYGPGIVEFTKNVAAPVKVIEGGIAFSGSGTVAETLTIGPDGSVAFPANTAQATAYTIPCTTLVAADGYRNFIVGNTTYYGAVTYDTIAKTATYYMTKPKVLAINFRSNVGSESATAKSEALGVDMLGAAWMNSNDTDSQATAINLPVYDTLNEAVVSGSNAQIKWGSANTWNRGSQPTSFLGGYLDDGPHDSISGATVEFSQIPFAKYSVVVYSWGDGDVSRAVGLTNAALGESQVAYTANALGETVTGTGTWGNRTGKVAYGVNALRVDGLTGTTLKVQGNAGTGGRGPISAVMIIEAPTAVAKWTGAAEDGNWDTAGNWSTGAVPTATDKVLIPDGTTINATATSAVGEIIGENVTIVYTGSVAQPSASMASWFTSAAWTGTVKLQDNTVASSLAAASRELKLAKFGNENSTIILTGVTGWWIDKETFASELVIENNSSNVGFTITDGGSTGSSTFKKLSGSGVLKGAGGSNQGYVINDASEFTGTIDAATKCFSFGTTSRWGQNIIVVDANNEVTVSKNWQATSGMTINGTVHLTSSGSIPSVSGSGTVSCEGKVPNNDGLTQTGWTGTVLISETISTGSTKFGNAGSTLEVAAGKTLTLTEATSIDAKLVLGSGAKVVFTKADATEFSVNAGALHNLSSLANIEVPAGAALVYVVQATAEELGKGTTTVAGVPVGAAVRVGSTTSDPSTDGTVTVKTGVKIDGNATIFDITFKNNKADIGKAGGGGGHFDYKVISGADLKWDSAATFTKTAEEEWDDSVGCYIKHHPYIDGAKSIFSSLTDFTTVVVGTMSPTADTQFIHFGSCSDGRSGLFLATTSEKDKVLVASNVGSTVKEITTLTVPNAATARHVYVITKYDTETESIFSVYLDGVRRAYVPLGSKISLGNSGHSGVQVGSSFGGALNNGTYKAVANNNTETGAINVLRVYDYLISWDQITALTTKYPYESEGGLYMRTIGGDANFSSENSWSLSGATPEVTKDVPTSAKEGYDPSFELAATQDATVTVNASANIEVATFNGSKMTFKKSGEYKLMITDSFLVNNKVKIEYGAIDISGALVSLRDENCTLEIDMTKFSVDNIYTTTMIPLTGEARETDNVTVMLPTPLVGIAVEAVFEANRYQLKVTPNHQNGATIYYDASGDAGGNMAGAIWTAASDPKTQTCAFPGDTIVFGYGSFNKPKWMYSNVVGSTFEFASDVALGLAASTSVPAGKLFDEKTVRVDEGATLTLVSSYRNVTLGDVTTTGTGNISFIASDANHGEPHYAPTADAISGTAKVIVADGITLTVTGSVECPVEVNGTIKAGAEITTVTTTKANCFVKTTVANGVYTYAAVEVTGADPLPLDDIKPGESVTPAQDAKPIWSDTAAVDGEGGKYIVVDDQGALVVKEGAPVNGLDSFKSYVLGLDPEDETSKPYLSGADTTSTTTLKLIPAGVTVKEGYTVTPKLRVGTTPTTFEDDSTALSGGGFTITLPTAENEKVKYYQIEYTITK